MLIFPKTSLLVKSKQQATIEPSDLTVIVEFILSQLSLSVPFEIAQAQGASINKLTSAIKKIRDERQATQDKNKARKIIKAIDPLIKETFKGFQNQTDIGSLEEFYKKTDIKNFRRKLWFKNKRVKELVGDYIYKEQIQLGDRLNIR